MMRKRSTAQLRDTTGRESRTTIKFASLALFALAFCVAALAGSVQAIEPYSENNWYWQHDWGEGTKPVMLIGASGDDNPFQWAGAEFEPALVEKLDLLDWQPGKNVLDCHLDLLARVGGNWIRNALFSRFTYGRTDDAYPVDYQQAWEFAKDADGKYDLTRFNEEYFDRLAYFLEATKRRRIFVGLEFADYQQWSLDPFNPVNNKNYTWEDCTGLCKVYSTHDGYGIEKRAGAECVRLGSPGHFIKWILKPGAGTEAVTFRYASTERETCVLKLNGATIASVVFPASSGAWKESPGVPVHFREGKNTLVLKRSVRGPLYVDRMTIGVSGYEAEKAVYYNFRRPASHAAWNSCPFWAVPPLYDDPVVRLLIERRYRKILDLTLRYDHVLYHLKNESCCPVQISDWWCDFVHEYAASKGKRIYVTENRWLHDKRTYDYGPDDHFRNMQHIEVRHSIVHPRRYDFIDQSNISGEIGQHFYDCTTWLRDRVAEHGVRPINFLKNYWGHWYTCNEQYGNKDPRNNDETWLAKVSTERMWKGVCAGVAAMRFHRNGHVYSCSGGLGLSPIAQTHVKSLRMFVNAVDLFSMEPHNDLLSNRDDDEAYCIAQPGKQYGVYFTGTAGDRSVDLDLTATPRLQPLTVRWLDIKNRAWLDATTISGGGVHTLRIPGPGRHWAVAIRSVQK